MVVRLIWREKERVRVISVQIDKFRGLLSIMEMDKVPNEKLTE